MGEVFQLNERVSQHFINGADSSDLRVTWHFDQGLVVLSLWRESTCVGSAKLSPQEASRLVSHISDGLAVLATERTPMASETSQS
jgi:hypothetical protein